MLKFLILVGVVAIIAVALTSGLWGGHGWLV